MFEHRVIQLQLWEVPLFNKSDPNVLNRQLFSTLLQRQTHQKDYLYDIKACGDYYSDKPCDRGAVLRVGLLHLCEWDLPAHVYVFF